MSTGSFEKKVIRIFNAPESWKMTETDKVVALVREIQCWRLGNWDGCVCSHFSIRNVDVEVRCGKGGEQCVKVSSRSGDYQDINDLRPIADEVLRQIKEQSGRSADQWKCYINEAA